MKTINLFTVFTILTFNILFGQDNKTIMQDSLGYFTNDSKIHFSFGFGLLLNGENKTFISPSFGHQTSLGLSYNNFYSQLKFIGQQKKVNLDDFYLTDVLWEKGKKINVTTTFFYIGYMILNKSKVKIIPQIGYFYSEYGYPKNIVKTIDLLVSGISYELNFNQFILKTNKLNFSINYSFRLNNTLSNDLYNLRNFNVFSFQISPQIRW